ncbi:MAG: hypothetical protein NXI20_00585 [bacterium]|nr:hypothetical protein [bacterium]
MDVFEKIAQRKKQYEKFLSVVGALSLTTIYTIVRWEHHFLLSTLLVLTFTLGLVYQLVYMSSFNPKKDSSKNRIKTNRVYLVIFSIVLIMILEAVALFQL